MKCGRPMRDETQEYCVHCRSRMYSFESGRSIFRYEGKMRESVGRMKFHNRRDYLDFYAQAMAYGASAYLHQMNPAVIVPVPMHPKKRRERGFDQCRILARKLGELTGIPVREDAVERVRYTRAQKGLRARERQSNLRGAFRVRDGARLPEPILLIDDIFTTGTTMEELAGTLRQAGYQKISFLTLCSGYPTEE